MGKIFWVIAVLKNVVSIPSPSLALIGLRMADLTEFVFNHVESRYISYVILYITFFGIVEAHIKYI